MDAGEKITSLQDVTQHYFLSSSYILVHNSYGLGLTQALIK